AQQKKIGRGEWIERQRFPEFTRRRFRGEGEIADLIAPKRPGLHKKNDVACHKNNREQNRDRELAALKSCFRELLHAKRARAAARNPSIQTPAHKIDNAPP